MIRFAAPAAGTLLAALFAVAPTHAEIVTLSPVSDNTLYENATGSLSNGAGSYLFAGRTGQVGPSLRRALLRFDLSSLPTGAVVESVTLTLNQSHASVAATPTTIALRRVLASWGEGTSNAIGEEGMGAPAAPNDATWVHRFFAASSWGTPGGDFAAADSAATTLAVTNGPYTWGPTATMKSDVEGWITQPATNFGWILIGDEANSDTARRFDSKENLTETGAVLTIVLQGATGAGRVPDGNRAPGPPLLVSRLQTGELSLTWGSSCMVSDTDYIVYEGTLGNFTSHAPKVCSTAGVTSWTLVPPAGSAYYLVNARNATMEGSLGVSSAGTERPPGASQCLVLNPTPCP